MPAFNEAQNRIRHAPARKNGAAYNSFGPPPAFRRHFTHTDTRHEVLHPDTKRD